MFRSKSRTDYYGVRADRPKPQVPDFRDAPKITGQLQKTLEYIKQTVGDSDDFVARTTRVKNYPAALLFYSTITDQKTVEGILSSIQRHSFPRRISQNRIAEYLVERVLPHGNAVFMKNLWEIREALSRGEAILLVDGLMLAIAVGALSVPHREPQPPMSESSTRGPQVGFVENVEINVGLMRRTLASDALTVKQCIVGYRSRTKVCVVYQHDVANPVIVETVVKRIEAVHVDKLTGSATLEQRIIDNHWTLFPLTRSTQRLDNTIKEVGQGKVAIFVDGDPTVFIVPANVIDFFQTMEDDQHSYIDATYTRWLRALSMVMAAYLPALYIAFSDFNPSLLPHLLSLQIARSREGVPFPAMMEVTMMQIVIEIIREAALRMPKAIGQTLGIVGGLVLGEASVQAGLVSNILIVVIALTALSVYVTPSYEFATTLRVLTWGMILASSIFGFYGILLADIALFYHLSSLKSFGASYLDPIGGEHWRDFFLDGIFRAPLGMLDKRAEHLHTQEPERSADYTDPVQNPMLEKVVKGELKRRKRMQRR